MIVHYERLLASALGLNITVHVGSLTLIRIVEAEMNHLQ
jgi:hypothetical protein